MAALNLKSLPPIYAELARTKNLAADAALVEGLAQMEPAYQAPTLDVLLHRDHDASLAQVVALYSKAEPPFRSLLIDRAELLAGGIRIAMTHSLFDTRRSAIELIRDSQHGKSAYLLSEALTHSCRHTATLAAEVLFVLAEVVAANSMTWASSSKSTPHGQLEYVSSAVTRALSSWSLHFRNEVVMAAILLIGPLEDAVFRMAEDARTPIARALNNAVAGAHDPRLVGYCVRALRCAPLRESAAKCLATMSSPAAEAALADHCWLLLDADVLRACSRITNGPGLDHQKAELNVRGPRRKRAMIRMIAASGGKSVIKTERLGELALSADPTTQRAAFWALIKNDHEKSDSTLQAIASRGRSIYASLAAMELRRRNGQRLSPDATQVEQGAFGAGNTNREINDVFEPFWLECDSLDAGQRRTLAQTVADGLPEFDDYLRGKWALNNVDSQVRALKIIEDVEHVHAFQEEIQQGAESPNAVLRSLAVRLLGSIGDAKSHRLIRRALDDEDSRVQANAVESFAQSSRTHGGSKDAATQLRQMVDAKSNRVRANAIMALLQMRVRDGAESLIKMLNSPSSGHRTSALWVVEHLNLALMMERLMKLADSDPDMRVQRRAKRIAEKFNLEGRLQAVASDSKSQTQQQGVAH
jgi:hypothetical protein